MPTIIGICGYKGAGKSTVAKMLQRELPNSEVVRFAQPIKDMITALLKNYYTEDTVKGFVDGEYKEVIIPEIGVSTRKLMQTLGTEWGRDIIDPDIWVKLLESKLINSNKDYLLVDDLRTPNELDMLRKLGATIIKVHREISNIDTHSSENYIDGLHGDYNIHNTTIASIVKEINSIKYLLL